MSVLARRVRAFIRFSYSRRAISIYKGTIAYIAGFILIFTRDFDKLSAMPTIFSSMILILIIGSAGKPMGACHLNLSLTLLGVGIGAVGFVILGYLVGSQVAQGFVFAVIVYIFALVKAAGMKWFPFALLAILTSFNGIYSSIVINDFNRTYLVEYLKTYCWGAAIVLAVNTLIFPITSEKELRQTLSMSLEHIATFSHLLCKAYLLELAGEEKEVKDHLAQGIRADFRLLTQKINETFVEINYSRFTTTDYQRFVSRIRNIQQALIMAQSSLVNAEDRDISLFKSRFLPNTMRSFNLLRAALNSTMQEIISELRCKALAMPAGASGYAEYMDLERQGGKMDTLPSQLSRTTVNDDTVDQRLQSVSRKLEQEASSIAVETTQGSGKAAPTSVRRHRSSTSVVASIEQPQALGGNVSDDDNEEMHVNSRQEAHRKELGEGLSKKFDSSERFNNQTLRRVFDRFTRDQHKILIQCLTEGKLHGGDDSLRLLGARPSLQSVYHYRYVPSTSSLATPLRFKRRRRNWMDYESSSEYATSPRPSCTKPIENGIYYEVARETNESEEKISEIVMASHNSLSRVYSFMFALDQFVTQLDLLYHDAKSISKPSIRFHYFPHFDRFCLAATPRHSIDMDGEIHNSRSLFSILFGSSSSVQKEMRFAEAVSILEHRTYQKSSPTFLQRLSAAEHWMRSATSIYAAKTAAATTIFSILILHPIPRPWFLNFNMNSGVLTIITALTPTLGQSIPTFVFQIVGSGFGFTWALICLEIFHNVGGYYFNPYGIVSLLLPFALAFQYILYSYPQFFVISLLAQIGAGNVLIAEWINRVYIENVNFDSPGLRTGKAFATLGVALGLVGTFQLLVLRNPSRRALRKRIGALLFSELGYLTLLQAFVRGVLPTDPRCRAPDEAIIRVRQELRRRELKLQTELIDLRPLVGFAKAEARFVSTFPEDAINRILRTSQILLDRMREARIAISHEPLPDTVLENFVQVLAPYRRREMQVLQLGLYLVASAVLAKSPLLRETPAELESATNLANFIHDMLVLASRHARTSEGAYTVHSGSFMRYFHYLVSMTSLYGQVKVLEDSIKDLYGELEDLLQ